MNIAIYAGLLITQVSSLYAMSVNSNAAISIVLTLPWSESQRMNGSAISAESKAERDGVLVDLDEIIMHNQRAEARVGTTKAISLC